LAFLRALRIEEFMHAIAPALSLAAVLAAACSGKDPYNPGTPIGTYHVVAHVTSNECGQGVGVTDPWEFDIRLAVDPHTLYWVQGGPSVGGVLDASSHATLASSDTRTVHEANPRAGLGFCSITRTDGVDVTLAADQSGFTGSLAYTFTPTDGSDCSDQLAGAGAAGAQPMGGSSGTFAALPCATKLALTGTRTALPPSK
jgi:hypothetical protein